MLDTLTIHAIPEGEAGIKVTLHRMAILVRRGIRDERILVLSRQITTNAPVANKAAELKTIFEWMVKNIRYVQDPVHIEFIMHPAKLLEVKAGDCDDLSILFAALAESIGVPARFVAVKTLAGNDADDKGERRFNHVYPEAYVNGAWVPYDVANIAPAVGQTTPNNGDKIIQPVTVCETSPQTMEEFSGTVKIVGAAVGLALVVGVLYVIMKWKDKNNG
jgi:hypothetical protein